MSTKTKSSPQRKARPQAKPAPIARVMWAHPALPGFFYDSETFDQKSVPVAVIDLTPENWERMVAIVRGFLRVDNWGASKEDIDCQAVEMFAALGLTAPESRQSKQGGKGG